MQSSSHGSVGVLPGEQVVHIGEYRLDRVSDERTGVGMVVGALDIYGVIFFVLLERWGGGGAVGVSERRRWGWRGGGQFIERRGSAWVQGQQAVVGLGGIAAELGVCIWGEGGAVVRACA